MNDYVAMIRLTIRLFLFEFIFLGLSNFVYFVESLLTIYYFYLLERLAHKLQNLLGLQQWQDERWWWSERRLCPAWQYVFRNHTL